MDNCPRCRSINRIKIACAGELKQCKDCCLISKESLKVEKRKEDLKDIKEELREIKSFLRDILPYIDKMSVKNEIRGFLKVKIPGR